MLRVSIKRKRGSMANKYISCRDVPASYRDATRVRAWGNLNEVCLSVDWKGSGGVKWLQDTQLRLVSPKFHIQPAGHRKIAQGGNRSVVARVSGDVVAVDDIRHTFTNGRLSFTTPPPTIDGGVGRWVELTYNPVDRPRLDCFHTVEGHHPITSASELVVAHSWKFDTRTGVRLWALIEEKNEPGFPVKKFFKGVK